MTNKEINLDFFFDPICPWAYLTSRWILEVKQEMPLSVNWKFVSLALINKNKYGSDPHLSEKHKALHEKSIGLLRASVFVRNEKGNTALEQFYSAIGRLIHEEKHQEPLSVDLTGYVPDSDLLPNQDLIKQAAADESLDAIIEQETTIALKRAGDDVGTPIITYDAPDGPSFFGPVISSRLKGKEALELFNTIYNLVHIRGFHELKQSIRSPREL